MQDFKISLISKYRNVLMGIGILDVLIWHLAGSHELSGLWAQVFGTITRTVFTPGFLFLSGFGIYFSYSNNSEKKEFYKRRLYRLLIPYWIIITVIFLIRLAITGFGDLQYYLGTVTTLFFWLPGRTFNYWYIAVIILFYLVYPFVHDYVFGKTNENSFKTVCTKVVFICSMLVLLNIALGEYYPYYHEIDLAIPKLPMLFIGMFTGYLAKQNMKINLYTLASIIIPLVIACYFLKSYNNYFDQYYYIIDKLLTIPLLVVVFEYLQARSSLFRNILPVLGWLGTYTLELYVIHIYLMRVVGDFPQLPMYAEWWIAVPIALLVAMPASKFTKFVADSLKLKQRCKSPT